MQNQYDNLFTMIIDRDTPSPTIVINHIEHMNRIRAGLNRCRVTYNRICALTGETDLKGFHFTYQHDEQDRSKVTISLKPKIETEFRILS